MAKITSQQKREFKSQLHFLKPVVIVSHHGLTDGVLQEINRALEDHELIKIRLSEANRDNIDDMVTKICKVTNAILIQIIGKVIAIYKKMPKKDLD